VIPIPVVILRMTMPPSPVFGLIPMMEPVEVSILLMSALLPSPVSGIFAVILIVVVLAFAIIITAGPVLPSVVVIVTPVFLKIRIGPTSYR
jgi:hypothetical protein